MTALKTVLVPVSSAAAEAALEAAFRLGGAFDAHITALHVRMDPTTAVPLVGEGMSGALVEEMLDLAERQSAERAAAARAAFENVAARHGVVLSDAPGAHQALSAEWLELTGREEDLTPRRARLNDLLVMGHPGAEIDQPSLHTLNAALLESGRPLLLAPAIAPETIATSIALAWNGSAEASRAVAFAMPLLVRARHVTILSLAEEGHASAASAGELATALAWHGIAARTISMHAGAHAGQPLLDECATLGADLLVMGAYTHSRLRQFILGGVTRHVLAHARLPVLMCH